MPDDTAMRRVLIHTLLRLLIRYHFHRHCRLLRDRKDAGADKP